MSDKILSLFFVDDESTHLEAIRRAFSSVEKRETDVKTDIHYLNSLTEYHDLLLSIIPDIVIIDMNLLDGNAIEILSSPPSSGQFPVIVMTSHGDEKIAVEIMKAGAIDYVVKSPEAFLDMPRIVSRALREWNLLRDNIISENIAKYEQNFSNILIESIPGTFYVLDKIGNYVKWNAYQRDVIVGKSDNDMIKVNALNTIHKDDRDLVKSKIENVLKTGKNEVVEGRVLLKGGPDFRWMLMTGNQITINNNPFLVGIGVDITEKKIHEEKLKASEIRYRRLFEAAKDGILILDAETGMVVDVNPFITNIMGYSYENILGKAVWELGFLKDIIANKDNFLELQQKQYVRYEDLPLETFEGKTIDVEFVSNVYLVEGKKVIQCNIRDITQRVLDAKELKKTKEFLDSIIENIPDTMILIDHNRKIMWSNDNIIYPKDTFFCPFEFEKTRDEAYCVNCSRGGCIFEETFETGNTVEIENYINERYFNYKAVKCHENGKVTSILVIIRDVTERKNMADRADMIELQSIVSFVIKSQEELKNTILTLREEDCVNATR